MRGLGLGHPAAPRFSPASQPPPAFAVNPLDLSGATFTRAGEAYGFTADGIRLYAQDEPRVNGRRWNGSAYVDTAADGALLNPARWVQGASLLEVLRPWSGGSVVYDAGDILWSADTALSDRVAVVSVGGTTAATVGLLAPTAGGTTVSGTVTVTTDGAYQHRKGVLVEPAIAQLFANSLAVDSADTANWDVVSATAGGAVASCIAGKSAYRYTPTANTGRIRSVPTLTLADGETFSLFVLVRYETAPASDRIRLAVEAPAGTVVAAKSMAVSTLGSSTTAGVASLNHRLQRLGGGWYLFGATWLVPAGGWANAIGSVYPLGATGATGGVMDIAAFCAHRSPYLVAAPIDGAVTKAADSLTVPISRWPAALVAQGTLFVAVEVMHPHSLHADTAKNAILSIDGNTDALLSFSKTASGTANTLAVSSTFDNGEHRAAPADLTGLSAGPVFAVVRWNATTGTHTLWVRTVGTLTWTTASTTYVEPTLDESLIRLLYSPAGTACYRLQALAAWPRYFSDAEVEAYFGATAYKNRPIPVAA